MALLSLFLVPLSTDPTMKSTPRLLRQQGPVRSANTEHFLASTTTISNRLQGHSPVHRARSHYFMTARPTPLESSTSRATSPTLSSTSPPLPAPAAPDNPLIQGALSQMMSIFEKRIQERDAEFEDHWAKMLEATAERDSAKMDLMTERALWNEEKKVLQQQISLLEVQLKEREAAIEGATPGTKRPRPESMVAGAGARVQKQARTAAMTSVSSSSMPPATVSPVQKPGESLQS